MMDLIDDFDDYDGNDAITCIVEGAACFAYWEWWWIKVERKTEREDENVNLAYLRFLLDFGSTWRVLSSSKYHISLKFVQHPCFKGSLQDNNWKGDKIAKQHQAYLRVPVENRLNGCFGLDVARSTWKWWKDNYDEKEYWDDKKPPTSTLASASQQRNGTNRKSNSRMRIGIRITWLVLHTSLCLFFSCSHWIISTLIILNYLILENTELSQLGNNENYELSQPLGKYTETFGKIWHISSWYDVGANCCKSRWWWFLNQPHSQLFSHERLGRWRRRRI